MHTTAPPLGISYDGTRSLTIWRLNADMLLESSSVHEEHLESRVLAEHLDLYWLLSWSTRLVVVAIAGTHFCYSAYSLSLALASHHLVGGWDRDVIAEDFACVVSCTSGDRERLTTVFCGSPASDPSNLHE